MGSEMCIRDRYGIPRRTLRDRLQNNKFGGPSPGPHCIFTKDQEKEICDHALLLSNLYYGISREDLCSLAYEYATQNGIPNNFKKKAGKDWYYGFMERNPKLSLRTPEGTSLNRVIAFNRLAVGKFFNNLITVQEKHHIDPKRIYNMDETGISTVQKPQKILASKGQRQVGKVISYERGQTTTVICCVSASGHYILPFFIYARARMNPVLMNGAPPGSIGKVSASGWTNKELFLCWIDHFVECTNCSKDNKVILILDNHESHIGLEAYNRCREKGIIVITLPPHSSHKMQPLDLSIFGPLKSSFYRQCDWFMKMHPGRRITQYEIAGLFHEAWKTCTTLEKAENGFRA